MDGFEYGGTFYRWHVSDMGKDLMLIDRFSNMPLHEFFEIVDDGFDRGRAPILLTLIATSIRHGHPEWSVERVIRTVQNLSLSEITFIEPDEEEEVEPELPPASEGEATTDPTGASSPSPSRFTPSDPAEATFETSSATPD
jgi:hypothetical protein